MLLVELLRKKVDEIRMKGISSSLQRAGRVVWLGSLVFFNIRSAGRKILFGILWILCATTVVQRIAFTEFGKRSYAHARTPGSSPPTWHKSLASTLFLSCTTTAATWSMLLNDGRLSSC
jgi:hypothetical protein